MEAHTFSNTNGLTVEVKDGSLRVRTRQCLLIDMEHIKRCHIIDVIAVVEGLLVDLGYTRSQLNRDVVVDRRFSFLFNHLHLSLTSLDLDGRPTNLLAIKDKECTLYYLIVLVGSLE